MCGTALWEVLKVCKWSLRGVINSSSLLWNNCCWWCRLILKPSGPQSFSSVVFLLFLLETVQKRMDEWDLGGGGPVLSSLPLIKASKERQTSVLDEGTCAGKCNLILRCHYDMHHPGRLPAMYRARNINVASILLCIHTTDSPLPLTCPLRSCVHGGTSAMDQNMQINVGMNSNKQRYQQAILWLLSRSLHARQ